MFFHERRALKEARLQQKRGGAGVRGRRGGAHRGGAAGEGIPAARARKSQTAGILNVLSPSSFHGAQPALSCFEIWGLEYIQARTPIPANREAIVAVAVL
jgi:hypothetical protein